MTPPETRYAKSGELRIAYQVVGSGPLDLVFVPGFVSNLDLWWEEPGSAQFFSLSLPFRGSSFLTSAAPVCPIVRQGSRTSRIGWTTCAR